MATIVAVPTHMYAWMRSQIARVQMTPRLAGHCTVCLFVVSRVVLLHAARRAMEAVPLLHRGSEQCYFASFFPNPIPVQRRPQRPTGYHAALCSGASLAPSPQIRQKEDKTKGKDKGNICETREKLHSGGEPGPPSSPSSL